MSTKMEAIAALQTLRGFIGNGQLQAIGNAMRSEEKQFFFDKVVALADLVSTYLSGVPHLPRATELTETTALTCGGRDHGGKQTATPAVGEANRALAREWCVDGSVLSPA
jgi:hypothetical protein